MAYERQTWACGDTITADKLNHIEEGLEECCSGGGTSSEPLVGYVRWIGGEKTFSLTYAEMAEAYSQGRVLVAMPEYNSGGNVYGGTYSPIYFDGDEFKTTVLFYDAYNDALGMWYCEIDSEDTVTVTPKFVNLT